MLTRRAILAGSALSLLLPLAPAWAQGRADNSVIRVVVTNSLRSVMPGKNPDVSNGTILQHIYEGLVAAKSDGGVELMLAESVDVSEDGTVYTFTLRDGITFHNGKPLTSAEVVWTWERFLDPQSSWPGRSSFDGSQRLEIVAVTPLDDRRVSFTIRKPSAAFLSALARPDLDSCGIAHPDAFSGGEWVKPVGTGPYMFSQSREGEFVELKRFDAYKARSEPADGLTGEKLALIETLRFVQVQDESSAALALRSGDVDVYYDAAKQVIETLRTVDGISVASANVAGTYNMMLQSTDPILKDRRVRQAINLAIDKENMVTALYGDMAAPLNSFVPRTSQLFTPAMEQGLGYDPARAAELLREAGYAGQPISIQTNSTPNEYVSIGVLLQAMLQSVGINATVSTMENASKVANYQSGNYQGVVLFGAPNVDPIFWFERLIGSKAKRKEKVWDNQEASALLDQLFETSDLTEKRAITEKLHKLWVEEAPMVTWANRVMVSAFSNRVQNFQLWPGLRARLWNVSLADKA